MKIDAGDVSSSPLPHRPTAWSMVVVAANSFSGEAQRKQRKDCPQHLPDSTTMNIKFSENRRGGRNRLKQNTVVSVPLNRNIFLKESSDLQYSFKVN